MLYINHVNAAYEARKALTSQAPYISELESLQYVAQTISMNILRGLYVFDPIMGIVMARLHVVDVLHAYPYLKEPSFWQGP